MRDLLATRRKHSEATRKCTASEFNFEPTWEIAFNHFHHRLGLALPEMAKVLPTNRPTGADLNHMVWETLTHEGRRPVCLPSATAAARL